MRKLLFFCFTMLLLRASGQNLQAKTPNNVLEFKWTDGTPIPQGEGRIIDTPGLAFWMNHQATLKDLLKIKTTCKHLGLYLNYRNLYFDQGQKLSAIVVDYAVKHGNAAVAVAYGLTDSTRFGVFGVFTDGGLRFYVGYKQR